LALQAQDGALRKAWIPWNCPRSGGGPTQPGSPLEAEDILLRFLQADEALEAQQRAF
jgi:hypothetical protein